MKASLRTKVFVVLTAVTLAVGAGIIGTYTYSKKDAEEKPEEISKEVALGSQASPIRSSGSVSYTRSATPNTPPQPATPIICQQPKNSEDPSKALSSQASPIGSSESVPHTISVPSNALSQSVAPIISQQPEQSVNSLEIVQIEHSSTDPASNNEDKILESARASQKSIDAKQIFDNMLMTVNTLISESYNVDLSESMKMNDHAWIVIIKAMGKIIEMNEMTAEITGFLSKVLELLSKWVDKNAALVIKHAKDILENAGSQNKSPGEQLEYAIQAIENADAVAYAEADGTKEMYLADASEIMRKSVEIMRKIVNEAAKQPGIDDVVGFNDAMETFFNTLESFTLTHQDFSKNLQFWNNVKAIKQRANEKDHCILSTRVSCIADAIQIFAYAVIREKSGRPFQHAYAQANMEMDVRFFNAAMNNAKNKKDEIEDAIAKMQGLSGGATLLQVKAAVTKDIDLVKLCIVELKKNTRK